VEKIRTVISRDGRHRLDIEVSLAGLYRYVTFDDRYRHDPDFHDPPEWTIDAFSGLYESAQAAEADAIAKLAWHDLPVRGRCGSEAHVFETGSL